MYELKLMLVMILCVTTCVAQLGLNEEREDLKRGVNCNLNCQSKSNDPVCGTNGRTYDSICDLERDICKKVKVKLKHSGECSLAEKCEDDRAFRLDQVANNKTVHVPTCLPDGSYAPVQCHNYTFICWCSRVDGQLIPETIQKDNRPQCLGDRTSAPATESPQQDRCRGRKRKQFFNELNKLLMQGYRQNTRGGHPQRDAIEWKFADLDNDGDRVLKRREYSGLRRSVKKFVKPKKCSRQFPRFCDINQDKKLTKDEWMACFSARPGRTRRPNRQCKKRKNCDPKSPNFARPKPSCKLDRNLLLQEINTENNSIPIPDCQPNGKYQPIQCHRDICFCVDELTGNSLEGTAVTNGTPDCTKPLPHAREWTGCTGKKKTKFMQDLKKYLVNKVPDNERTPATDASSPQTVEEFATMYHFRHLDKDNNNFLEKKERKEVKKFLKRSPKLRACGKKLTEYCDVDNDQKVSVEEWMACVIFVPQEGVSNGGGVGKVEIRRYEENPLHKYLIAEDEQVQNPRNQRDVPIPLRRFLNQKHNNT